MTVSEAWHTYTVTVTYSNQQTLSQPGEGFVSKLLRSPPQLALGDSLLLFDSPAVRLESDFSSTIKTFSTSPFFDNLWRLEVSSADTDTQINFSVVPRGQQQPNRPNSTKKLQKYPIQLSLVHGTSHHAPAHGMNFLSTGKGMKMTCRIAQHDCGTILHSGEPTPGSLQGQQLDIGDKETHDQHVACREMTTRPTHGLKILCKGPERWAWTKFSMVPPRRPLLIPKHPTDIPLTF